MTDSGVCVAVRGKVNIKIFFTLVDQFLMLCGLEKLFCDDYLWFSFLVFPCYVNLASDFLPFPRSDRGHLDVKGKTDPVQTL